jgi:MFS family permease
MTSRRAPAVASWLSSLRLLVGATAVSTAGTMVSFVALPLTAVLALDASPLQVGFLTAAESLPILLLGIPVGSYVDGHRRRPIMLFCDVVRGAALMTVPLAWWLGILHISQLIGVAFVVGAATVLFDVAYQSYVPGLVPEKDLSGAYRRLEAANAGARLAGPGAGGILVQLLSAPVALLVDVCSYVASFFLLVRLRHVHEDVPESTAGGESARSWAMSLAGFSYVLRNGVLRSIALFAAVGMFASAMMAAVEMVFLIRVLDQSPASAGLLVTAGAAGALVAVSASGRLRRRLGQDRMLRLPVLACWPFCFLLPLATPGTPWLYAGGAFFIAAGGVLANIEQNTLRPMITPAELRGRVNAAMRILMWGSMPLGAVVGGALGQAFGTRTCLWVVAVLMQLAIIPLLLPGMRHPYPAATAPGPDRQPAEQDSDARP